MTEPNGQSPVPVTIYAAIGEDPKPALPTYHTVADVLEKKNGSGWRLAGWTVARTLMIAPPMLVVGVPAKQAFAGAALASAMISVFTLIRIAHAGEKEGLGGGVEVMGAPRIQRPRGTYA
jgi:hypothetical protein